MLSLQANGRNAARQALISPGRAGEINRARLVQILYDMGPLSRAELARITGVSRAVIGTFVQSMIDTGLLAEGEPRSSGAAGGKPSRPLWFASDAPPIAAANLLPGSAEAALISAGGTVLVTSRHTFPTGAPDGTLATQALITALEELLGYHGRQPIGVGIAVNGMVDTDTGAIVRMALAPSLDGLAVGPIVSKALGLPVWIDHYPRVQAFGDRWFGQGRGHSNFASIYAGETLGLGIVIGGVVHRGPAGSGGEIGHTTVQVGGQLCRCGRTGCWETIASHRWLRAEAMRLGLPGASSITAGPLSRLAARGQPHAAELLDLYARNLSIGLVNLHQTMAPGLIILHGDTVAGGEALRSRIEAHVRSTILHHPAGPPQIAFTTLDDHAPLVGAAGLVLSYSLQTIA
jgi:predicted NBD/HSP70 family sugar kinase